MDSVITISQIEVIDRQRLLERITKLDEAIIEKIEKNILFILGIRKV
jgi:mRNA-degrading endonuclease toxin of MazEF toxin-antitoxin module